MLVHRQVQFVVNKLRNESGLKLGELMKKQMIVFFALILIALNVPSNCYAKTESISIVHALMLNIMISGDQKTTQKLSDYIIAQAQNIMKEKDTKITKDIWKKGETIVTKNKDGTIAVRQHILNNKVVKLTYKKVENNWQIIKVLETNNQGCPQIEYKIVDGKLTKTADAREYMIKYPNGKVSIQKGFLKIDGSLNKRLILYDKIIMEVTIDAAKMQGKATALINPAKSDKTKVDGWLRDDNNAYLLSEDDLLILSVDGKEIDEKYTRLTLLEVPTGLHTVITGFQNLQEYLYLTNQPFVNNLSLEANRLYFFSPAENFINGRTNVNVFVLGKNNDRKYIEFLAKGIGSVKRFDGAILEK